MTKEQILEKLRFDMELRGRQPVTIEHYVSKVRMYQDYFDKPADQMGEAEINEYLHYLLTVKKNNQSGVNTYKPTASLSRCRMIRVICILRSRNDIRATDDVPPRESR